MANEREKVIKTIFRKVMLHCKQARKTKTNVRIRSLAQSLDKTENYITSIENGREMPSLRTFFEYLYEVGFDFEPFLTLKIQNEREIKTVESSLRDEFVQELYSLKDDEVKFLFDQAKLTQRYRVGQKKKLQGK